MARRRLIAAIGVAGTFGTVLGLAATPAFATTPSGELLIKGLGSLYAGSGSSPAVGVPKAGASTYTIEVKNTGTVAAQFLLREGQLYDSDPGAIRTFKQGSADVSSAVESTTGWFTPLIAPGKLISLTYKVATPKVAHVNARFSSTITLYQTDGQTQLGFTEPFTEVTSSTDSAAYSMFMNGPGEQPVGEAQFDSFASVATAPPITVGSSYAFTLKAKNFSTAPLTTGSVQLTDFSTCTGELKITVKRGSTDISSSVTAYPGAAMPTLAPGATQTYTITVKYLQAVDHACLGICCGYNEHDIGVQIRQAVPYDYEEIFLRLDYAA